MARTHTAGLFLPLLLALLATSTLFPAPGVAAAGAGESSGTTSTMLRTEFWLADDVSTAECGTEASTPPTMFVADATTLGECETTGTCVLQATNVLTDSRCLAPASAVTAKARTYIVADYYASTDCSGTQSNGRFAVAAAAACHYVPDYYSYMASCTEGGSVILEFCLDQYCSMNCTTMPANATDKQCLASWQVPFPSNIVSAHAMLHISNSAKISCAKFYGSTTVTHNASFNSPLIIGVVIVVIVVLFSALFGFHYVRNRSHPSSASNDRQFVPLNDEEASAAVPNGNDFSNHHH